MLLAACEQFLDKTEAEIQHIALVTLEGHQRAIMGSMTVEVNLIQFYLSLQPAVVYLSTLELYNSINASQFLSFKSSLFLAF